MSKQRLKLLALLIIVFGAALWSLWRQTDDGSESSTNELARSTDVGAQSTGSAVGSLEEVEASKADAGLARRISRVASTSEQRNGVRVTQSFADDRTTWIEGSVAFPSGAPPDDTLTVLAITVVKDLSKELLEPEHFPRAFADREPDIENGCWSLAHVSDAGRFRIAVPNDFREVVFHLDGRYLRLDPQTVTKEQATSFTLQPKLGFWLVARCVVPAKATEQQTVIGATVIVVDDSRYYRVMRDATRTTTVDEDGRFEVRGLRADASHTLTVAPAGLTERSETLGAATAGTRVELTLAFEVGARITGRVVDESGKGIAGAVVVSRFIPGGFAQARKATSDQDGRFELRALAPGKLQLLTKCTGFVAMLGDEIELHDQQLLDGTLLTLRRGRAISGRVTWPDGSAVAAAELRAEPFELGRVTEKLPAGQRTTSDATGEFTLNGLSDRRYIVSAWAQRALPQPTSTAARRSHSSTLTFSPPIAHEEQDGWKDDDRAAGTVRWFAEQEDVAAGTKDLVLALAMPPGVRGRVIDEQGAPVVEFEVRADPEWTSGSTKLSATLLRAITAPDRFHSEDGTFLCAKVTDGKWFMRVEARGLVQADEPTSTLVPQDAAPLVITMARAAAIAGRVTDPAGNAIESARVRIEVSVESGSKRELRRDWTHSNARGEYALEDLFPGSFSVTVEHDRWARSEPVRVTLVSGQQLEDVVLTLRSGGSIVGEAFAPDGTRASGRTVTAFSTTPGCGRSTTTDARGAFAFEHLMPGAYDMRLEPLASEQESKWSTTDEESDANATIPSVEPVWAKVKDGETTHVVLGEAPSAPRRR